MSSFFRPYEGKLNYVFISYSHRNSDEVLQILNILNNRKLRLWYDEGIPAGSDWPQNIADHMETSAAVLFFRSKTALASPNCRSEIERAVSLKKPLLVLPLDGTAADDSWKGLLPEGDISAELKELNRNPAGYAERVLSWSVLNRSFYRNLREKIRWDLLGLALAMLFMIIAAAGLTGVISGRFDRWIIRETEATTAPQETRTDAPTETEESTTEEILPSEYEDYFPVEFPDILQARAIRTALGKKSDESVLPSELSAISGLYFAGSVYVKDSADIMLTKDSCTANDREVDAGMITDLSVIGTATHMTELFLIRQPIEDLSTIENLVLLRELSLGGCEMLSDLDTLPRLPSLSSLHLEYSSIRDLTPLLQQPALKTVTVSRDMLPLMIPEDTGFQIILLP